MSGHQEVELQRIKGLFDKGLIDEEEYKTMKRQVIMGSVTTPPPSADMANLSDMGTTIDGPTKTADGPPPDLNAMGTVIGSADFDTIGSYRVLELLGQGGMGSVFKGRHINEQYATAMGDVAIKMIQPSLATDASFKSRFINEAIFGKKLSHPNIASMIDVVDDSGVLALLMDFVEGQELTELIPKDGMSVDEVVRLLTPIASALDYLHEQGIVHRDMKPANVRVKPDGTPVILDFGIAKDTNEVDSNMTQTGTAMGTQTYMAPEQMDAKRVTGAADQYALAMMAYQMLSGKLPWDDSLSSVRITMSKMTGDFTPLESVSGSVGIVVMRGLSLNPEDRYSTCIDFVAEIENASSNEQLALEDQRRQEEQERIEQERLAEDERLAEVARLAEEAEQARQKEEQARKLQEVQKQMAQQRAQMLAEKESKAKEDTKQAVDNPIQPVSSGLHVKTTESEMVEKRSGLLKVLGLLALVGGIGFFYNGSVNQQKIDELETKEAALQQKLREVENTKNTKVEIAQEEPSPNDETAAQELLKDMQTAMGSNDIATAKAKYAEIEKKYSETRVFRRASKMGKELEVFGKAAPASLTVDEWFIGDSSAVNLSKGVSLLVFWEVWCPHCKREVPQLQKTYDTYKSRGLRIVGLTKLTRGKTKAEVMAFLKEKNVSYPIAKETGQMSTHFNVSGIPAAAVVKDGTIVWRGHPARLTDDMLNGWLQ